MAEKALWARAPNLGWRGVHGREESSSSLNHAAVIIANVSCPAFAINCRRLVGGVVVGDLAGRWARRESGR